MLVRLTKEFPSEQEVSWPTTVEEVSSGAGMPDQGTIDMEEAHPQTSARSTTCRPVTLKDQLDGTSQSETDELIRVPNPEKVQKMVIAACRGVTLRLIYMVTLHRMQRVEMYWEAKTLGSEFPREEQCQPKPTSQIKKRRDDGEA